MDIDRLGAKIKVDLEWKTIEFPRIYLESILTNLLSNALKYRMEGRTPIVTVRTLYQENRKVLEIEDNGRGINLERYGSRMFGLQNRFHRNTEGKGVGLFMSKAQMESQGGSIHVESKEGEWTKFRLYF